MDQQDVQRLVRVHVPARGLDLGRNGTQCLLGPVGREGSLCGSTEEGPDRSIRLLVRPSPTIPPAQIAAAISGVEHVHNVDWTG